MADWEHLRQDLKESNFAQVDYIAEKLMAVTQVRAVKDRESALMTFSDAEIEIMAETEHSRWNPERLLSGWRLGPRDAQKKRSPYLVPWSEVPDDVKEWDRASVCEFPSC